MYVVTFYSFKGGTGRSMALANVAADLLGRGKRVLAVDFDLEAPGLDTFPMQLERPVTQGLVEMISDYITSRDDSIPAVRDYIYRATLEGVKSGTFWLMPAGCQDASYDTRFKGIDWQRLYEEEGGFLFFEDLKLQWQNTLQPDYVLIDSRTGHTDIGGICTRQLPDSVVAMFFPNEQNLRGLAPVVAEIRREESGPLKKQIGLHFVMGNVPDLDDEDAILSHISEQSSSMLSYRQLAATIHHVSSFAMLEQRLLLVDRPRSKIAQEYRELTNAVVKRNLGDRDGAISVLDEALSNVRGSNDNPFDTPTEDQLRIVRSTHSNDTDVIRRLAKLRRAQRRMEDALDLFEQILRSDLNDAEALVGRAEILAVTGKKDLAIDDLVRLFTLNNTPPFTFELATRLMVMCDSHRLSEMIASPSLPLLPLVAILDITQDLQRSYELSPYGVAFIKRWSVSNMEGEAYPVVSDLALLLIASGEFVEAQELLSKQKDVDALNLPEKFNYAMAEWGKSGVPPKALFKDFVFALEGMEEDDNANWLQCFSLAHWVVGYNEMAKTFLRKATEAFSSAPGPSFSAWSYLYRSPNAFRDDLRAMEAFYETGIGVPLVFGSTQRLFPLSDSLQ